MEKYKKLKDHRVAIILIIIAAIIINVEVYVRFIAPKDIDVVSITRYSILDDESVRFRTNRFNITLTGRITGVHHITIELQDNNLKIVKHYRVKDEATLQEVYLLSSILLNRYRIGIYDQVEEESGKVAHPGRYLFMDVLDEDTGERTIIQSKEGGKTDEN